MPAGSNPTVTPEPASASTDRCVIPSPPQTRTSSAPASRALRARFGAFFDLFTSYQSGSVTPAASRVSRSASNPAPCELLLAVGQHRYPIRHV